MTLVFLSNYFNHHQKPLSDALYEILADGYTFIETEEMSQERKNLGWGMDELPSYVVSSDCLNDNTAKYLQLINSADVVIIGSAPEFLIKERKKSEKLIFRYSERPLKNGLEPIKYLPRLIKWHIKNPFFRPIYLLCASAYTARDYAKFGLFKKKSFKWGYFTEVREYDVEKLIERKKKNSILWVARFIDIKHPEICVEIAKRLKADGYNFTLTMIGTGELLNKIKVDANKENVNDCLNILGSMTPNEVRTHMEDSQIFIFTSDKREGWGAVLNESMNSACATVASNAIGSVPFLIDNDKNGLIYQDGDIDDLYAKITFLLDNEKKRIEISKNAYQTMVTEWNPKNAAKKLIYVSSNISNGLPVIHLYKTGVFSSAE